MGVFPAGAGKKTIEQEISLAGINPKARIEALDALPGKISFLPGSDSSRWVRGLATYSRLRYNGVYPGIDLLFYGNHGKLEYDFVVAPGADPGQIRLHVDAAARVTEQGELQLGTGAEGTLHRPLLYQNLAGGKRMVTGSFASLPNGDVVFRYGNYDSRKTLVIDPAVSLLYATYLGGLHDDEAYRMALDSQNNAYILGKSASQDYPISANAYQSARTDIGNYTYNMVLTKMSPSGVLLYSTFIGDGTDIPFDPPVIAVDRQGNAWIAGVTTSTTFPVTANAYQGTFPAPANQGSTALAPFFSEISPDGSTLVYSSFFAGPTGPYYNVLGIAVNGSGQVYLAGAADSGLPTTAGAYLATIPSGDYSNFVAVFDTTQSGSAQLLASSYFGMPESQYVTLTGMALDASGNPWIVTHTNNTSLPTTANAIQPNGDFSYSLYCGEGLQPGQSDGGYVAKLSADLTTLLYGSYLSGGQGGYIGPNAATNETSCDENITGAATDANGDLYIVGYTGSNMFPITPGAYQTFQQDFSPGAVLRYVAAISSDGSQLLFSTFLGVGGAGDLIGVDGQQNAWLASNGTLPITPGALQSTLVPNQTDGSVAEVSSDGTTLLYGTYLPQVQSPGPCYALYRYMNATTACNSTIAGFAVDPEGDAYVAGTIAGAMVPVTANAFQSQFANGNADDDANDIFFMILGGGTVSTLSTAAGGNTGDATITISGAGFQQGVTCSLVQNGNPIFASYVTVNSNGTSVTCTFPLAGASTGAYDVVVNYPDGSTVTDPGAFTVQNGGQPQIWTMLSGRSAIRVGTPSQVFLNYGNSGTQDADLTTLWVALPSAYSFTMSGLTNPTDINCPAIGLQPISFGSGGMTYIPLLVPLIPAGSSNTVAITVTAPAVSAAVELGGYAEEPWFSSLSTATQVLNAASSAPANVPNSCVNGSGTADCLGPQSAEAQPAVASYLSQFNITDISLANDTTSQLATDLKNILSSASANQVLPWLLVFDEVAADLAKNRFGVTGQCSPPFSPPSVDPDPDPVPLPDNCTGGLEWGNSVNPWGTDPCKQQTPVASIDPNDKTGPDGDGSNSRYVRPVSPFVYTLAFENQAAATAPASQVVITDVLNPANLDPTTVTLGNISFGGNVISVPGKANSFSTLFPINSSLSVRIQGSLNPGTNTVKWTFTSIDPSTGLPPSDPTVGFLPPDTNGVEGQGSVTFTVMPKSGQTTGTQITNQATVVFDTNTPISTPTWLNTLDVNAPQSSVQPLAATETQNAFNVTWSGSDVGAGIASYTVYVSDDGGPFTIFQNAVAVTSASFTGQAGHSYGFYSIATDGAGNVQGAKTTADAVTTVVGGNGPGGACDIGDYGSVTVADVQLEIDEALGVTAAVNDLNGDHVVNAVDIQIVMNAALRLGCTL